MAGLSSSNESQPLLGKSLGKACGDIGHSNVATIEASLVSDSARNFPDDRDQDIRSSSSASIESEGNSLKGVRDRLKFIFPALAIGVSHAEPQTLTKLPVLTQITDIPCCS